MPGHDGNGRQRLSAKGGFRRQPAGDGFFDVVTYHSKMASTTGIEWEIIGMIWKLMGFHEFLWGLNRNIIGT